jgi:hypothetical protein
MRRRPRRLLATALFSALGAGTCFPATAAAQEVADAPQYRSNRPYQSDVDAANPEGGPFQVTGGVDVRDHYFFRGYNQNSSGVIVQPYFDLLYTVYEKGDFAVTPHVGAWFNLTEEKGPETPKNWNEFDAIVGVAVDWQQFTFDFQWVMFDSPNEAFERSEEVGVNVTYDDSALWPRDFVFAAINPSVAFFHEYYDKNDSESDMYFGIGLEPQLHPFDVGRLPVTVSFPLTFGGSYNGYFYDDGGGADAAGFWSAGVKAGFDLPTHNSTNCRIEAEVTYIRLLADSVERANGDDNDDVTLRLGFSFAL